MYLYKCRNVLPIIINRLISSSKESKNILKGSVYFTSHKYKMQYTILSGLGNFVLNLNFVEKDMHEISNAVAHYLDIDQPISFQVIHFYYCTYNIICKTYFYRKNLKNSIKNYMKNTQTLYGYIYSRYILMNMSINQKIKDFLQ